MYRYFTAKNTRRYIDILQDVVYAYNNTRHSLIKMATADVTHDDEDVVRARLYPVRSTLRQ